MTRAYIEEKANDLTQEYIHTEEGDRELNWMIDRFMKYKKHYIARALAIECMENRVLMDMLKRGEE